MIWHREPLSNGKHTPDRPRGLHPAIFGPTGSGWAGVAERIVGIGKDGTISDRPFDNAEVDPSFQWKSKLCDYLALESACERINDKVGDIGFYIGAPTGARPDTYVSRLVASGLVQLVAFDATAHQPENQRAAQFRRYESLGATIGYEAVPNVSAGDLWKDSKKMLVSTLKGWKEAQFRVQNLPMHPNRNVPELAIASPVLLLDILEDVAVTHAAIQDGNSVAINMLAANWKNRPTFVE